MMPFKTYKPILTQKTVIQNALRSMGKYPAVAQWKYPILTKEWQAVNAYTMHIARQQMVDVAFVLPLSK
jgi:hypothetical protein